jgi:hypothetical protein
LLWIPMHRRRFALAVDRRWWVALYRGFALAVWFAFTLAVWIAFAFTIHRFARGSVAHWSVAVTRRWVAVARMVLTLGQIQINIAVA